MKMNKRILFLLFMIFTFTLTACQKKAEPADTPDEDEIIKEATEYFEQMRAGDFETFYNALPEGVKKQTKSPKTIQKAWDEAAEKAGGLPEDSEPEVTCYGTEKSDQIRVEFVIPCEKEDFKVLINYDSSGRLYNYVIWKNN
jgi:hypothetical protein